MPIVCGFYLEREKTAGPGSKGFKNGETSVSKVMFGNKNQKERDRDETKNYYNTSV